MELFGCCSHYQECSNQGRCLFLDDDVYAGCYYNKNLIAGKNFYSKKQEINELFIFCYDRLFRISLVGKNGYSYQLSKDEIGILLESLEKMNIPVETVLDKNKCIIEGRFDEPANSRVIFRIADNDQQYFISNFNGWYILNRHAAGIVKSFTSRGIDAQVKLCGYISREPIVLEQPNIISENKQNRNDAWLNNAIFDAQQIDNNSMLETKINISEFIPMSKKKDKNKISVPLTNLNDLAGSRIKQLTLWDLGLG
jgi:hypothetical protein